MPEPMTDPSPPTAFRRPPAPLPLTSPPLRPRSAAMPARPAAATSTIPLLPWAIGIGVAVVILATVGLSGSLGIFLLAVGFLWLAAPFLGIWIWMRKRGHWAMGLLWGWALGPFVPFLLFAEPRSMPCPQCGLRVPKVAKVCGHCRAELVPA